MGLMGSLAPRQTDIQSDVAGHLAGWLATWHSVFSTPGYYLTVVDSDLFLPRF